MCTYENVNIFKTTPNKLKFSGIIKKEFNEFISKISLDFDDFCASNMT